MLDDSARKCSGGKKKSWIGATLWTIGLSHLSLVLKWNRFVPYESKLIK